MVRWFAWFGAGCILATVSCQTSSGHGSSADAAPDVSSQNECSAEGFMCSATPGCGPGYVVIQDLFCGSSGDYCCQAMSDAAPHGTDATIEDVELPDVPGPEVGSFDAGGDAEPAEAQAPEAGAKDGGADTKSLDANASDAKGGDANAGDASGGG
jgi:hypothetical protein